MSANEVLRKEALYRVFSCFCYAIQKRRANIFSGRAALSFFRNLGVINLMIKRRIREGDCAGNDRLLFGLSMLFMLGMFTTVLLHMPPEGFPVMYVPLALVVLNMIVAYDAGLQKGMLLSIVLVFAYGSYILYRACMPHGGISTVDFAHVFWAACFPVGAFLTGNMALTTKRCRERINDALNMEKLVAVDEITGFYTEREFFKKLDEEFSRAGRYKSCFAVLVIRITNYDELQIAYGMPNMAEIMKALSRQLRSRLRFCDGKFLLGDGMLSVLLIETDEAGVRVVAEKLHLSLDLVVATIENARKNIRIRPAIAFACLSEDDRDARAVYERAKNELPYDRG